MEAEPMSIVSVPWLDRVLARDGNLVGKYEVSRGMLPDGVVVTMLLSFQWLMCVALVVEDYVGARKMWVDGRST